MSMTKFFQSILVAAALTAAGAAIAQEAQKAWRPTKPVALIVPAGAGGADQMARFVRDLVAKHKLMDQPILVQNKSGSAGAEGFLDVKHHGDDGHKIVITLSNLFTTPLSTGVPFSWRDLTPIQMMALDEFVLWVHADTAYKSARDVADAVRKGATLRMGGTGSKQEDQILTVAIERAIGKPLKYTPFRGGGDVSNQLASKAMDLTVNNPIEAVGHWRAGAVRPLCVFDAQRMPHAKDLGKGLKWSEIPTCREQGLDVEYLMLRGFFMGPDATPEQIAFYEALFARVRALPEWKDFMQEGAFRDTSMTGKAFREWLERAGSEHLRLMREAGFLALNH